MRRTISTLILLVIAPFVLGATMSSAHAASQSASAKDGDEDRNVITVDCGRGQTIAKALQEGNGARPLSIQFTGTCHEDTLINRDDVELRGFGNQSLLVGLMDVKGSSRIYLHDFRVQGVPGAPLDTSRGGINIIEGSSATVRSVEIDDINARGLQVAHSAAVIGNVTVNGGHLGAFVFRAAQIFFEGNVVATNSVFGMSLVYSAATAKGVNLTFDHNVFGLLVQANSTLEHIVGTLTVNNSSLLGIGLFGQGVLAYGSFIEEHNNQNAALHVDELSSFSPLIGAPGGGPSVTITDNPGIGIAVTRGSTCELATLATIERNATGLQVDSSYLRMANTTVAQNSSADISLTFGTRAEFTGGNQVGTPVQCDSTVLARGTFGCGGH